MPELPGELAVLGHEPVGGPVQGHRGADGRGFLADAGRQGHHPSLSLKAHAPLVEAAASEHHAVPLERELIADRLLFEQLAVLV